MKPLVSVILLSYKSTTLYEALDSVLEQDYDNVQLIVYDDGTPGLTAETIDVYISGKSASNIRECIVIHNDVNQGTVRSLNNAISRAEGEIIFTLAGDDRFADSSVLSGWTKAFKESSSEIMTAFCEDYDSTMTQYIETRPYLKQAELLKTRSARELFELYIQEFFVPGCCIARTKRFIEKFGLHDERFRLIEDAPMILTIWSRNGTIGFWDRVAVRHRTGGVSAPENINIAYENDLNNIFELVIKSTSNNLRRDKKRYFKYIARHKRARKYEYYCKKYQNKKIKLLLLGIWFYSKYPVTTLRSFLREPGIIHKKLCP
ncbi:glycosyltransferase [Desulfoscipio sp. XC116]|uniref:glycosyltransferase family 2 protein n=1 Tax=Desulfoscipio sp. XC116 TaxID=3144975 RepID=UPI00325B2B6D